MIKVAVIGVMAAFLAIPLKKDKPEFSMLVILSSCLVILFLAAGKLQDIIGRLKGLGEYLGEGADYLGILLKMVGITYVAELGANLCHDAGYAAVAHQIEFYGKLMIIAVSMPVILTLIETIAAL